MKFKQHLANYVLGNVDEQDLIHIATNALVEGYDSPSLRILAGESDTANPFEINSIFKSVLRELEVELPTEDEAIMMLLCYHIEKIAEGRTPPRERMETIMEEIYYPGKLFEKEKEFVGESHDLNHLIGCYYSYDDIEERPKKWILGRLSDKKSMKALDQEMIEHAKEWLKRHC